MVTEMEYLSLNFPLNLCNRSEGWEGLSSKSLSTFCIFRSALGAVLKISFPGVDRSR